MGKNDIEIGDEEENEFGLSCTLDMFSEYDQVKDMINNITSVCKEFIQAEKAFEDLKTLLDQYQEQPHLLDSHIQSLIDQLLAIIRNPDVSYEAICLGFQYLWLIVKVRGYKIVMKKMPHEVKDLIPVLNLLEREEFQKEFYGSFILLMWLSIIIYMPFNMKAFDSSMQPMSKNEKTIVERILSAIKKNLRTPQSSREMAAFLASRFVTRPDLRDIQLPEFIDYSFHVLEHCDDSEPQTPFHKMGVLRALGLIFKHGKREELIPYSSDILRRFLKSDVVSFQDTSLRKFSMKFIQRIGLTFLRPKLASWRYHRGCRSLSMNLGLIENTGKDGMNEEKMNTEDQSDIDDNCEDVPSEVEDIIDYLLNGLKDKDTVVRWSAAKGIGRVTCRLPRFLADDVVGAILELFSTRESERGWHGGCLALAELARRGLLLPERLPEVLPILERALVYDELRGQCSVGANIRDAACYLCWAFARAYHPDQLTRFVNQLATGLLIVSLFDREIPCRRAGSAAFQEHVGRQGNFPYGIEILTNVDYFAVGNRSNAYINLSVFVGKYPEYTQSLIDHLVDKKVGHWDNAVRELAAKALHNLTPLLPNYVGKSVLPILLRNSVGTVLITRHGSLLATGHVIHALAISATLENKSLEDYVESSELSEVYSVVSKLEEKKLYRGMGGEYMRQATATFIEKCCLAAVIPMGERRDVVEQWHKLLEECFVLFEDNIRSSALVALAALWSRYYKLETPQIYTWRDDLITRYVQEQKCDKESKSMGYTSALGYLPENLVRGKFDIILNCLLEATKITPATLKWAQVRKEAINAIIQLSKTAGVRQNGKVSDCVCEGNAKKICTALLHAFDDYSMDRRGDIGAWVREAAMQAVKTFIKDVLENNLDDILDEEIVSELITRICQQSVERIDRTRKVAGTTFGTLLYSSPMLSYIPNYEIVKSIFPLNWCKDCNWASESATFGKFVQLLDLPKYRTRVLLGLTYALGGVAANLSRYTLEALQNYLNDRIENEEQLLAFFKTILALFEMYQRDDRIILPLIKSLSNILSSCSALDELLQSKVELIPQLLTCLKKESVKCSDYHKLSAIVVTLCELLRMECASTKSIIAQLTIFLGFQYPKVRAITATSFLTALQDYSDREIVPQEHLEEVTSILEDTPWMDNMEQAREKRNTVCCLLGIPTPQPKKKPVLVAT